MFVAFIPLSNWLRGFDRYAMRYSKVGIPESTFKDAFYLLREDEPWTPGLSKARRLIDKLGIAGNRVVALRVRLPSDAVSRNDVTGTGIGWRHPRPDVPLAGLAWVDAHDQLVPTRHEEVTASAFGLEDHSLARWSECRPRSFSVLPIANACQARCAFCFSKASVSDLERQQSAPLQHVLAWADEARERGAERAVITGGGEPTLLAREKLKALVRGLSERFNKTLLITNGARLDSGWTRELRDAGLNTIAFSRHGLDAAHDARVMGLAVDSAARAGEAKAIGLRTRAICVLQKNGVSTATDVAAYVQRSASEGFDEVCFKELYVSSTSENPWAPSAVNQFCAENQAPLAVVLEAMEQLGFEQADALPWGSPVFTRGAMRVAAYTEPSVGWERTHRLVRSWNVMADGKCLASLEDEHSEMSLSSKAKAEAA
ncbi:MAG: radical SAM protein [Archangium sp.]